MKKECGYAHLLGIELIPFARPSPVHAHRVRVHCRLHIRVDGNLADRSGRDEIARSGGRTVRGRSRRCVPFAIRQWRSSERRGIAEKHEGRNQIRPALDSELSHLRAAGPTEKRRPRPTFSEVPHMLQHGLEIPCGAIRAQPSGLVPGSFAVASEIDCERRVPPPRPTRPSATGPRLAPVDRSWDGHSRCVREVGRSPPAPPTSFSPKRRWDAHQRRRYAL